MKWQETNIIILKDLRYDVYVTHIIFEKMGAKSNKYKFVEYPKETIGYYLYHPVEKKYLSKNMLPF
jgi:hypothetical protein